MVEKYSGFIFDMDGTIYRGSSIIRHADRVVNNLMASGKDVLFATNKTTSSVEEYVNFLRVRGLKISAEQIVSSTEVIKNYLIENYPGRKFFALGEPTFVNQLNNHVVSFTTNPEEIDIVIVTLDRTLNFEKIEIAAKALELGAKFFAANIDDTCPVKDGEITDAGTVITALEKRTGRRLEDHFGKPSVHMFNAIKKKLKYTLEEYLIIGDRMQTDIRMGVEFGVDTALVSTGVKNFPLDEIGMTPKYKFNSVADLLKNNFDKS